jgi:hypothetical protein
MIDELTLVREQRPDTTGPDRLTVIRARRALLHRAMEGRRRRRRRVIAVGVVTAATLAVVGITPPWGTTQAPAAAALLTSAHLAEHPEVRSDQYLHIRKVERNWGYGDAGQVNPWMLEYWVPGDGSSSWVERSGEPDDRETRSFDTSVPDLYVDHASDAEDLLVQLRDYARANGEGDDLRGLWTVAFWIVLDPVAPESFKSEVMRAVASLDGVKVADPTFSSPGVSGRALTMGGSTDVWFVVDPASESFRGLVGHPEKDETWVGPEDPMWTIVIESEVVNDAP